MSKFLCTFRRLKLTAAHTTCILCEGEDLKALPDYAEHHLVRCSNCSHVFSDAIPSPEELDAFYNSDYDRTTYFSPVTEKRYNELLDGFEKYRRTGRILDIGCGYGFFLETAKKRGWEVYGTEVSSEACQICSDKGIEMHCGKFEEARFAAESFDIVVSFEVIEHLQNPVEIVKGIRNVLRKGGLCYLTTPNFNAYLRYKLKGKYDVIDYPNHLSYFTSKTLRRLFTAEQFRTLKTKTTGISITRSRTSKGNSKQQYVSETSDDEMLRYRIEKRPVLRFAKQFMNFWLNLFGIGVSLKGLFVRR